jgi:hypothetical protein
MTLVLSTLLTHQHGRAHHTFIIAPRAPCCSHPAWQPLVPSSLAALAAAASPPARPFPGDSPAPPLPLLDGRLARCSVFIDRVVLPSTDEPGLDAPRGSLFAASYHLPGSCLECRAPPAAAALLAPEAGRVSGAARAWAAPLAHCGVHWVAADVRLARALVRSPLVVSAWRQQPLVTRSGAVSGSSAGTEAAGPASIVELPLGTAEVDLSGLLLLRPGRAEPATRQGGGLSPRRQQTPGCSNSPPFLFAFTLPCTLHPLPPPSRHDEVLLAHLVCLTNPQSLPPPSHTQVAQRHVCPGAPHGQEPGWRARHCQGAAGAHALRPATGQPRGRGHGPLGSPRGPC